MARHLTALAHGPVGAFAFVAPTDCGLGLFARSEICKNQDVAEYGGARLPLEYLVKGTPIELKAHMMREFYSRLASH